MLTHLGPFWNKIDRKTGAADTRQHIIRHDPDQQSRQNQNNSGENEDENDLAAASIDSLILFLESALPSGHPAPTAAPTQDPLQNPQNPAAYAAQAYASAGGQRPPPMTAPETPSNTSLSDEDIRTIKTLIDNLKTLKSQGIQSLPIREGHNFLDSLLNAIKTAN
jgi:hypothetical protein